MSGRRRGERATETGGREESGDEEDPGDSGCRDDIPVIEPITNGGLSITAWGLGGAAVMEQRVRRGNEK
ncbi:unnamed protein product [Lampetra planeri]